jgi:hypothetical protein
MECGPGVDQVPFDAIWVVPSAPGAAVDEGSLELTKYPVLSKDCECDQQSFQPRQALRVIDVDVP